MLVDCDRCAVRGDGCNDCVITALLGVPPSGGVELDGTDQQALRTLAEAGLVPRLQLVSSDSRHVNGNHLSTGDMWTRDEWSSPSVERSAREVG